MPAKRSVEDQLVALDELREGSPEAALEPLRKLLAHRNNYVVAKTADLVAKFRLTALIPELLAAFDRFFKDPIETDPQCWAKNSLARALAALECQDAAIFLRGLRHTQSEPVWGGRSDTAGGLRGACALALVQCRALPEADLLAHLIELLSDKDKTVRGEVVRAIESQGHEVVRYARSMGGDVLDAARIRDAAAGCEGAFHCAGKVSRRPEDA